MLDLTDDHLSGQQSQQARRRHQQPRRRRAAPEQGRDHDRKDDPVDGSGTDMHVDGALDRE